RSITYTYDAVGNRLTRTDSAEGVTTYSYDVDDRLLTETLAGQHVKYRYDNNGNTLPRINDATDQVSMTWDFENRLQGAAVTSSTGTHRTDYRYNADNIRVAAATDGPETRYLVDANRSFAQVLEEYTPAGDVQAAYVYGLTLISQERGGQRSFYHTDGL